MIEALQKATGWRSEVKITRAAHCIATCESDPRCCTLWRFHRAITTWWRH